MKLMRWLTALCLLGITGLASATNYTLWINGRTGGGTIGDYNSFTYWGPSSTAAGINKKAVNWDGYNSIASQSYHIRDALDCFCTGNNWCYIATHSAGDLMMGYTLANYGGSARMKKNAAPIRRACAATVTGRRRRAGTSMGARRIRRGRRLRTGRRRFLVHDRTADARPQDDDGARHVQPQRDARHRSTCTPAPRARCIRDPAGPGRRGRRVPQLGGVAGSSGPPTAIPATGSATT